jgi:hypothetical protein
MKYLIVSSKFFIKLISESLGNFPYHLPFFKKENQDYSHSLGILVSHQYSVNYQRFLIVAFRSLCNGQGQEPWT